MPIFEPPFSAAIFFFLPAAVAFSIYFLHRRAAFLWWGAAWALLVAFPFINDTAGFAWPVVITSAIAAGLFVLGSACWEVDEKRANPAPWLAAAAVLAVAFMIAFYSADRRSMGDSASAIALLAAGWAVSGALLFRRARWEAPLGAAVTSIGHLGWGWALTLQVLSPHGLLDPWGISTLVVSGLLSTVGLIALGVELARSGHGQATDLELLLEDDPNMICIVRDGELVFANRALRERSGRNLTQLRNNDPLRFLPPGEPQAEVEIDFIDGRGQSVPVVVHSDTIEWRGSKAWRYALVDLSEQREAEREVREMMKELQRMNTELEASNRRQTEFLSNTTHELKTPLTSIIANTEVLEYEMCGPINEEQRRVIKNISRNSQHLLDMITRLLAFASQREGGDVLRPQEVSVPVLVDNVIETVRPMLEEAALEVELEVEEDMPPCWLDPDKIYRVYLNLVENAIKFSPRGVISVGARIEDGELEGSVTDQGVGIPPDMLEDVFQPFRQVDVGSARSYGGVGLGLAICKHLVELHGGQIWAEPARPDGTTFRFRVPCDGHPRSPESPVDRASAK